MRNNSVFSIGPAPEAGFTLVEMSIVLVIIGLVVGGILTGGELIGAAAVRAQISQIEKYNTAVQAFDLKYGSLPGDMPSNLASQFGFTARAGTQGRGDGNGLIEGYCYTCSGNVANGDYIDYEGGELTFFWEDLSQAGLIRPFFNTATDALVNISGGGSVITSSTTPSLKSWIPEADIGNGNFVYLYVLNKKDYYGLSAVTGIANWGSVTSTPGLAVTQAFMIDKKMDDGYPQTGQVLAEYIPNQWPDWAAGGGASGAPNTAATPGSATTCYDNGNTNGAMQQYSVGQNGGNGRNCALSFALQ